MYNRAKFHPPTPNNTAWVREHTNKQTNKHTNEVLYNIDEGCPVPQSSIILSARYGSLNEIYKFCVFAITEYQGRIQDFLLEGAARTVRTERTAHTACMARTVQCTRPVGLRVILSVLLKGNFQVF